MAHYAKVVAIAHSKPRVGRVVNVIVADASFFDTFVDSTPGEWIQTSYNTHGNQHTNGGEPLRGNFAAIGGLYNYDSDVFYGEQPYPSWTLNESTWLWEAPVAKPDDGQPYIWDEAAGNWVVGLAV